MGHYERDVMEKYLSPIVDGQCSLGQCVMHIKTLVPLLAYAIITHMH